MVCSLLWNPITQSFNLSVVINLHATVFWGQQTPPVDVTVDVGAAHTKPEGHRKFFADFS